jgi:hypothetical protein
VPSADGGRHLITVLSRILDGTIAMTHDVCLMVRIINIEYRGISISNALIAQC